MKENPTSQSRGMANSWKTTSTATGDTVDHSIMAPPQSWASNKRIKLQGYRTSAKRKYKILAEFYYDAMQKVSDKCDKPPCQHLIDFTCNLIWDQCLDMLMYFPSSLTLPWSEELRSWDWIKCYTISLSEIRNLFWKQYQVDLQHLGMEWLDWCYWDVSVVTSLFSTGCAAWATSRWYCHL